MEGVASAHFRHALATIGGFDEACTEFLRVPTNAHVESLAKKYNPLDTHPIPQAAQIMGSDIKGMCGMTLELIKRGAPRIDLNCGCPSNTVTGRGAGSSLLKTPDYLYQLAKAMVEVSTVPVTIKLRSGFQDTSLFRENLLACQESGASYITLHPRTKVDGYTPPARWDLIAQAKELLSIPVVGNGDILTPQDALNMLKQTQCDALMIGRGALHNPWIFHEIKAQFSGIPFSPSAERMERYIETFTLGMPPATPERSRVNQLKQLFRYLFDHSEKLKTEKKQMLTTSYTSASHFLDINLCKLTT